MSQPQRGTPPLKSDQTLRFRAALPACVAAAGWFWGLALLATREHQILDYLRRRLGGRR